MREILRPFVPATALQWFGCAVIMGFVGLVGIIAASATGAISVAADYPDYPGIADFLHRTMGTSVARHAAASVDEPPDLARRDLIEAGAAHFGRECVNCHAAPGLRQPRYVLEMNPTPPRLEGVVEGRSSKELFWIVQHGIRMTAMPAWPSGGPPDEIWAMVAFLRQLPKLDAETYAALASPSPTPAATGATPSAVVEAGLQAVVSQCAGCHGVDGQARASGAFPKLNIQSEDYLAGSLKAFTTAHRASGIMQTAAWGLTDGDISALARHFSRQQSRPNGDIPSIPAAPEAIALGRTVAENGIPARGVAACRSCHRSEGHFDNVPVLSSQYQPYLEKRLNSWLDGLAVDSGTYAAMDVITHRLTKGEIAAVSAYYASLPPPSKQPDH